MNWKDYTYKDLINDIFNEFSSRFCVIDVQTAIKRINGELSCDQSMILLNIDPKHRCFMHYLKEWKYQNLISIILSSCSLSNYLRELCRPFVTESDFNKFEEYFKEVQKNGFPYLWQEDGLVLKVPEPFVDIVMYPLSQFHGEILNALVLFSQFVEAGLKENMYKDFYSPSIFTQFSQNWVADMFGINKTNDRIIVW